MNRQQVGNVAADIRAVRKPEPYHGKGIRYADDPGADYFLIAELIPGFLDGVSGTYRDPDGYFVSDAEAEGFDRQFPPKEKRKPPGQLI